MKRILSLVLVLALIATLGLSSAFAEEGFADGKFTEPHHITVEIFERPNDGNSDVTSNNWTIGIINQIDANSCDGTFTQATKDSIKLDKPMDFVLTTTHSAADAYQRVVAYAAMTDPEGNPGIIDLTPYLEQYKEYLPDLIALLEGEDNLFYDKDPTTGARVPRRPPQGRSCP